MLELMPDTLLSLSEDILLQSIPELDLYYAFSVASGDQFEINRTGHWALGAVKEGKEFQVLVQEFAHAFDLSFERAMHDVAELILYALENKIIRGKNHEERTKRKEIREAEDRQEN